MYVIYTNPYSVLKDFEDEDNILEVLWIKLRATRLPRGVSNIVIGVVYHPPNTVNSRQENPCFPVILQNGEENAAFTARFSIFENARKTRCSLLVNIGKTCCSYLVFPHRENKI